MNKRLGYRSWFISQDERYLYSRSKTFRWKDGWNRAGCAHSYTNCGCGLYAFVYSGTPNLVRLEQIRGMYYPIIGITEHYNITMKIGGTFLPDCFKSEYAKIKEIFLIGNQRKYYYQLKRAYPSAKIRQYFCIEDI